MQTDDLYKNLPTYNEAFLLRESARDCIAGHVATAQQRRGKLACALFDLDHFRLMLETCGPDIGKMLLDECLQNLVEKVSSVYALSYGRDEFLVLLPDIGAEDALLRAENMRSELAAKMQAVSNDSFTHGDQTYGCSAGVAEYPALATEATELLSKAEEGVYRAKRQGRNLTRLPSTGGMVLKSNYYYASQLERLAALGHKTGRSNASLLREALDRFLAESDS